MERGAHLDYLLPEPARREERQRPKLAILEQDKGWRAADIEIVSSEAHQAETQMVKELAKTLWAPPAPSVAGVIAKLQFIIDQLARDTAGDARDIPVPELRLIIADLVRIETDASVV